VKINFVFVAIFYHFLLPRRHEGHRVREVKKRGSEEEKKENGASGKYLCEA
jgi:hypothetical protein